MKIKKQDLEHLIITATWGERILGVFVLVIGIIVLLVFGIIVVPILYLVWPQIPLPSMIMVFFDVVVILGPFVCSQRKWANQPPCIN